MADRYAIKKLDSVIQGSAGFSVTQQLELMKATDALSMNSKPNGHKATEATPGVIIFQLVVAAANPKLFLSYLIDEASKVITIISVDQLRFQL